MRPKLRTRAFELAKMFDWGDAEIARRSGLTISMVGHLRKGRRGCGAKAIEGLRKAFPFASYENLFYYESNQSADTGNTTEAA